MKLSTFFISFFILIFCNQQISANSINLKKRDTSNPEMTKTDKKLIVIEQLNISVQTEPLIPDETEPLFSAKCATC